MEQWERLLDALVKNKRPLPWAAIYLGVAIDKADAACQRHLAKDDFDLWYDVRVRRVVPENRPSTVEYSLTSRDKGLLATVILAPIDDEQTAMDIQTTYTDDTMALVCITIFVSNWLAEREWSPKWKPSAPQTETIGAGPVLEQVKKELASWASERGSPEWWKQLFALYYRRKRQGKFALRVLADASGYSLSHIKMMKDKYAEYDVENLDTK